MEVVLDRVAVLSEHGSTRARHEPAIGATAETRLVGLRQSLVSNEDAFRLLGTLHYQQLAGFEGPC